jgi:hypothetical protein
LIGQVGNAVAGLFGKFPGGTKRNSGKYQLVVRLTFWHYPWFVLLVVLLGAGQLAATYNSCIGWLAILGFNIIDWKALKHLRIILNQMQ